MKLSQLQVDDIVYVVPMKQPAMGYHAKVEILRGETEKVVVRKEMNQITGRLALSQKFVWAHEIKEVRRRNGIPVTIGAHT